ncbi:MAG TPA: hypothetical protein PL110_04440 [Candidatus Eremiobacteraeota bacterium]|nr:MAG: hypothetical protein BWY64_03728 [bacterium ADurb.Bin363]HPZ07337.1 hypothetical protein [Candidatus Eremiobacteraeota bacterium]
MAVHNKNNFLDEGTLLADLMEERLIDHKNFQRKFIIDKNFYKKNSRDYNYVLANRFCNKKCYPRKTQFLKEGYLNLGSTEEDKIEDPVEIIFKCCGQQTDFIKSDMPLAEKIFRVFLKNKNQALNTHKISQELNYYNLNNIFYLLSNDTFYGFKEVKGQKN